MTANKNFKAEVRARAARTGESYTAARRHLVRTSGDGDGDAPRRLRIAVAQTAVPDDPRDGDAIRAAGRGVRDLMRAARDAGARLVHFGEGTLCSPSTLLLSSDGPEQVGPSDWDRFRWDVLHGELTAIADHARSLGLWAVVGAPHRLNAPHRPHNSVYVISDRGEVATRYDERMLSNTKLSFLYSPGSSPVTFAVDGIRFGCSMGMEVHFPELFLEHERLDVDCVLFSTIGRREAPEAMETFATEASAHAGSNSYSLSFATAAHDAEFAPSGIVGPDARWVARCPHDHTPAIAVADLEPDAPNLARPWRRKVRDGIYDAHRITSDPRSASRTSF